MEDDQRSAFAARGLDVDQRAGLIREGDVGEAFADIRARGVIHRFGGAGTELIKRVVHRDPSFPPRNWTIAMRARPLNVAAIAIANSAPSLTRCYLHQIFAEDDRPVVVLGDVIDDRLTGDRIVPAVTHHVNNHECLRPGLSGGLSKVSRSV